MLSNNDGCVIARSEEAKTLGIPMGAPFFKWQSVIKRHGVHVFSSNYALYGDLSQRVMDVLQAHEPEVEIYSIDEAFLRLPQGKNTDLEQYGHELRDKIRQWVGLPVSIGFGPTKTLAKVASRMAKKNKECQGVFDITGQADILTMLGNVAVGDVWGIGRRTTSKLGDYGVRTAKDLALMPDGWLRKQLTVTGLRTAMELRGISCLPLEDGPPAKKSITSSRSFGRLVTELADLQEAMAAYVSIAAEKLREQHLATGCLSVFLSTNRHKKDAPQYSNSETFTLAEPTISTPELIHAASQCLERLFRKGYAYQKVGVILTDLLPENRRQGHLFLADKGRAKPLMAALDRINNRWGRETVRYAAAGFTRDWKNRQEKKSPAYTTSWQDLPVVRASFPDSP